jgi:histidyl-tRNA synthetase
MEKTPTGVRDFSVEESMEREQMISSLKSVFRRYGFYPLETGTMEFFSTLTKKSGEAIKENIFRIADEEAALRFDLTVPLARYVSSNLSLFKPFKRYCIDRVWRNEEPQKGRYREFLQADCDIIGVKEQSAEVELLNLALDSLRALGFDTSEAIFFLNNRKILEGMADKWSVDSERAFRAIDKYDKVGKEGVFEELKSFGKEKAEEIISDVFVEEEDNGKMLKYLSKFSKEGAEELECIVSRFPNAKIQPYLVRGLGYYTGPIYELKLSDEIGTVCAGGRYDSLLGLYGQKDCAVGISFGFERLFYLLRKESSLDKKTYSSVYIAWVKDMEKEALSIATSLRREAINTDINYSKRSLGSQIDYANKIGIPLVVIVGPKEFAQGKAVLREMDSGKETVLEIGKIAGAVVERAKAVSKK